MSEQRYRSLLIVFGFGTICTVMSASRWLADRLIPFWAVCCLSLRTVATGELAAWLSELTWFTTIALLAVGLSLLVKRLAKTRRFVSELNTAAVTNPPFRVARLASEAGITQPVVALATETPLAFCFGLLRPRICVTTGLVDTLTDKELKAVLLHEDHHRRHLDPLRGLLAEVLATMLFFLPVAAEFRDLLLASMELEADRHAVRLAGRSSLAGALHRILTHPLASRLATPGIVSLSVTETRIAELLGDRPAILRFSARSLLTSSAILMLGCIVLL